MGKIILQDGNDTYTADFKPEGMHHSLFGRNAHRGIADIIMTYAPGYDKLSVTIAEGQKDKDFLDIRFKDYNGKNYFKRFAFTKVGYYGNDNCVLTIDLKGLKTKLDEVIKLKKNIDEVDAISKVSRLSNEAERIRKIEAIKAELGPILKGWDTTAEPYCGHPQSWWKGDLVVKMDWNGGIKIDNVSVDLVKKLVG